ncbi:MAG: ATP synthase subunit I [Cyanobacteria bacterium J06621_11]
MSILNLLGLFLVGLGLGYLYFGGLWFSLRRLPYWRRPFLGMGLSWLTRLTALLGLGGLLLRSPIAPPLQTVLLLSFGVWCSRNLLITTLIGTLGSSAAPKKQSVALTENA